MSRRRLLVILSLSALVASCRKETQPAEPALQRDLTVFAAASLRDSFTALGHLFEQRHPGTRVVTSFAGSQTLRAQIEHDAPADVFASADERHMSALLAAGRVAAPRIFAKNELVVVVSLQTAKTLHEFRQLPQAERIVLAALEVPVGEYTRQALERAASDLGADFPNRVAAHVVSREPDVRQVLAKVSLGEADAGVVYRTDALTAKDKVVAVTIPAAYNIAAKYPVAVTTHAPEPELAHAFVELLLAPEGARILADAGFLAPDAADAH